jgi:hypothetical protein
MGLPAVGYGLVELRQEQGAAQRRLQGGDQQAVVLSRQRSDQRARGVAAEAIGDQPLPSFGSGQITTDLAPEGYTE